MFSQSLFDLGRRVQVAELAARATDVVGELAEDGRRSLHLLVARARVCRVLRRGLLVQRLVLRAVLRADRVTARDELGLGQRRPATTTAAGGGDRRDGQHWKTPLHARKASAAKIPATPRPAITPARTAARTALKASEIAASTASPSVLGYVARNAVFHHGSTRRSGGGGLTEPAPRVGQDEDRSPEHAEQPAEPGGPRGRPGGDRSLETG